MKIKKKNDEYRTNEKVRDSKKCNRKARQCHAEENNTDVLFDGI